MAVTIKNMDSLISKLNALSSKNLYMDSLKETANTIKEDAQNLCPVQTGTLRDSITVKVNSAQQEVSIGTDVEYAVNAEYGDKDQRAKPFMNPALEANRKYIIKDIIKHIRKVAR